MAGGAARELQQRFAAHLRDPERCPAPPGLEDQRLGVYRDLFYRNVEGFMANAFPVLRRITPDARWHALVRDYFARHRAQTPLFPRMPAEFVRYLAEERDARGDPPFLAELAHYEWLEAEVYFDSRELDDVSVDTDTDLEHGAPIANPVMRLHAYTYPVHRIGPGFLPTAAPPAPTYLAVFRRRDDSVAFMELNAVAARLLDLVVADDGRSARELLSGIADELDHPQPRSIVDAGLQTLRDFLERGVLLGTRAAPRKRVR